MKKILAIIISAALVLGLCSCGSIVLNQSKGQGGSAGSAADGNQTGTTVDVSGGSQNVSAGDTQTDLTDAATNTGEISEPVTDQSVSASETNGAFSITSEDGSFTSNGSIYTITTGGTYSIRGLLEGQIVVDAGEDDEVVLELNGVTITYDKDSPIKIISAGNVDISAKKDSENVINDTRSAKIADDAAQGEGAIYAKCDLKLKGSGRLVINASYNNGVHTTKDLKIQKISLKVTSYNNAIKGNDSISILSGAVVVISTNGDGLKTQNTDASRNGVTRGDVNITGGSVTIYAAGDGIQAAHDFNLSVGEDGTAPALVVYTGSYSGYTASSASTTSYKGIKVQNELNISAGSVSIQSYDDGLHADYGTAFDDGAKGQGTINISGGEIAISVYSPKAKTSDGRHMRGGWGGQQSVSGADAIHADYTLNISGGTIVIDSAYEGLEANVINISGGGSYVSANDDGVNACKGITTPQVNISGGYLDVTVPASGDTDGIDSNGTYTQIGGIVITRGPNSSMAAAIDADGTVAITGGTLIILGFGNVRTGGNVKSYSLSLNSAGTQTVKIGGTTYKFTNLDSYGRTICYSDVSVSN